VDAGSVGPDAQVGWALGVPLPEAIANNALASVETEGGCMVFSMLGIDSTLRIPGIHNRAFRWREGDESWLAMPAIPGPGRLAANAVGLRGEPYLVGGYEVSSSGGETSSTSLQRFNLSTGQWDSLAPLPVPIDDAGVVAWRDRYIVVVSGWSNNSNVAAVQIYDADTDSWLMGTDFPGIPVFGSAAAIAGDELIIIDGVSSGIVGFRIENHAWRATLDPNSPATIEWAELGAHPGPARYRAAAAASESGALWFHGGTAEPYNFDGQRYDNGQAATPLASTMVYTGGVFALDEVPDKPAATMDHRSLVACGSKLLTVGGLVAGPSATPQTWSIIP
jgi:N-acetylneuraminic acid mutarotase